MAATIGSENARPARVWRDVLLVPTLVSVAALVSIVSSLGAPLIPTIAAADHVSLATGQWLLTAALLTGALATPVMGRLSDGSRQREVVLVALSAVVCGCVLAAASNGFALAVVGRGLQGVGLGLLPVTMAIARRRLSHLQAAQTIATLSITAAIGAGLGYPLTSFVAEAFGYRGAFWFGGVSVGGALGLAALVLPKQAPSPARRFDLVGVGALSLVVIGISVVLSEGDGWGWTSGRSLGLLGGCAVVLAAWVTHELRFDEPLVDLRQVKNRSVLTADVSGFLLCISLYLFIPVAVEFVQVPTSTGYGFGVSVLVSGCVLVPLSVGTFAASRFLASYGHRFSSRSMIPVGSAIFAFSILFFALEHRALWEAFVAVGAGGLGYGFSFAAMPGFIVRAVPPGETGSATAFYQVLRSIGLSVGSAVSASVLAAYTRKGHTFPSVGGFRTALVLAALICGATAGLSYVLPGAAAGRRTEDAGSRGPT